MYTYSINSYRVLTLVIVLEKNLIPPILVYYRVSWLSRGETISKKRERGYHVSKVFKRGDVDSLLDLTLRDFITKFRPPTAHYIVVRRGSKLYNVLKAVAIGHPIFIVVVDEKRRPIGYISEIEILRTFTRRPRYTFFIAGFSLSRLNVPIEQALNVPIEKIMEDRPFTVKEDITIRELLNMLRTLHLNNIIIVDKEGKLKTVIDLSYLVTALLKSLLGEPYAIT